MAFFNGAAPVPTGCPTTMGVCHCLLPPERGRDRTLKPVGELLREQQPELIISRQKLEQVRGIELVRIRREQQIRTSVSARDPSSYAGCQSGDCRNNSCSTNGEMASSHFRSPGILEFGVPFGQDRLVPIFLATLAVQQKSRTIRFRTAAEMLESFGMHTGGKEYRRLVAAFERIFGATIYFGTDTLSGTAKLVQRSRFNFMSEAQIWYTRSAEQRVLSSEFENVIVLTDDFYREVTEHPVPNDLDSVKVLASAPAVLDLYMWLSYRCSRQKAGVHTIFGSFGLVPSSGLSNIPGGRDGSGACLSSG
jgi:hypothetical protein